MQLSTAQNFLFNLPKSDILTLQNSLKVTAYFFIVFGIFYRIDYIVEFNPIDQIWSDPARHWEQGIDTLRFDPMSQTDPIGFQLYIASLAKLTLKIPELVAFYTCLLAISTPWVWYRFLRELQPNKNAALLGWATLSIIPSWISIYGYFMQETLFIPLLGAALWLTWRCQRKRTLASFMAVIVIWIVAGLTRGVAIPMAMVACTWLWYEQDNKLKKIIYGLLLLLMTLGPLAYRSYQIMHIFAPHGIGHMNMIYAKSGARSIEIQYQREGAHWGYVFQSPAAEVKPFAPWSDWQSQREGRVYVSVDIDKGIVDWEDALAKQPLSIEKYLWLTRDNLILLFFSESWPDSNRDRLIGEINYQTRWLWFVLALLCLFVFIKKRKQQKRALLLPAIIVTWFVVQGLLPISVNEGRYRMPFSGLIIAQLVLLYGLPRKTIRMKDALKNDKS